MISEQIEELAALQAVGLLDEAGQAVLRAAMERDPEVRALVESFAEASAALACDVPPVAPPPAVRRELMRQLPSGGRALAPRLFAFPSWTPVALAACLAALIVCQSFLIFRLTFKLHARQAELAALRARNDMVEMRLASLESKDAAYSATKIMVAWDPVMHHGMIKMENLPPPPPGHDYQLWVLDPSQPAPISAGLLKMGSPSQAFAVGPMTTPGPGFAISLEPAGGRPSPTGAILFAVAPSS